MSLHKKPKPTPNNLAVSDSVAAPSPAPTSPGCRRLVVKWLFRMILLGLLLLVTVPLIIYATQPAYYKILVIGSDQRGSEQARSDVLMLVAIPKSRQDSFSMIMIPRDTKIDHPEKGLQKITHFYAMWDDQAEYLGNAQLTTEVVEGALGITINGTVEVTFDSFTEIVDMLGGVDTETYGHLDGTEAQEIVHNRYNKAEGDFGRGEAQREILRNVLSRLKDPVHARSVYEYFRTTDRARLDISQQQLMLFGLAYVLGHRADVSLGEVKEEVLPGEGQRIYTPDFDKELYYWVLDDTAVKNVVNEYLQ